jgi:hypothetical protein
MLTFHYGFWTHEKFSDVFIRVLKVQYRDHKRTKLKIEWWARGCHEPYCLQIKDKLVINREDYDKWHWVEEMEMLFDPVIISN